MPASAPSTTPVPPCCTPETERTASGCPPTCSASSRPSAASPRPWAGIFWDESFEAAGLFPRIRDRLERNLIAASGGNPDDPKGFNRAVRPPSKSDLKQPEELVATYLGGTPVEGLFRQALPFTIPTATRFEHHHIIAGSGHGKTQTLQFLIGEDLDAVARGERSVIVIDSQGDLIRTLSGLAAFAPGGPLYERLVLIDPTDVEWPVSLNLFDVGIERLTGYPPLERERLTNSILELYDFVLGTLLAAEMTQKQNVIFRYVTRLMLHIPDATIHTLRDLMEPGSQERFAEHIAKLDGTARHFFDTEFGGEGVRADQEAGAAAAVGHPGEPYLRTHVLPSALQARPVPYLFNWMFRHLHAELGAVVTEAGLDLEQRRRDPGVAGHPGADRRRHSGYRHCCRHHRGGGHRRTSDQPPKALAGTDTERAVVPADLAAVVEAHNTEEACPSRHPRPDHRSDRRRDGHRPPAVAEGGKPSAGYRLDGWRGRHLDQIR